MDDDKLTVRHVKAARALLDWTQESLAEKSGVSLPSIRRIEALDATLADVSQPETVAAIRKALERAGIEFENGGRPGVRLTPMASGKTAKPKR